LRFPARIPIISFGGIERTTGHSLQSSNILTGGMVVDDKVAPLGLFQFRYKKYFCRSKRKPEKTFYTKSLRTAVLT